MVYDLSRLGERPFENLCRALAVHILGPGLQAFGDGPDGGREASFDGPVRFSTSPDGPWDGYGILQAKYRRAGLGTKDVDWLRRQVTTELDAWSDPCRKRVTDGRVPEYLIIATNVRLSSAARTGGIDRIRTLLTGYADRLGLKGWALWDANQLSMYLDAYPAVSARFAEFITAGAVLAKTFATLEGLAGAPARERLRVAQDQPGNERAFQAAYQAAGGEAVLGGDQRGLPRRSWLGPTLHRRPRPGTGGDLRPVRAQRARGGHRGVGRDPRCRPRPAGRRRVPHRHRRHATIHPRRRRGGAPRRRPVGARPAGARRRRVAVGAAGDVQPRDPRTRAVDRPVAADGPAAAMRGADVVGGKRLRHRRVRPPPAARGAARGAPRRGHRGVRRPAGPRRLGRPVGTHPDAEGHNDRRFASYRLLVAGTTGRPALGFWARFQLPDGQQPTVVSLLDMRVDFAAIAAQPAGSASTPVDPSYRPGTTDLERFFAAAWATATTALPLAATPDPFAVPPAGSNTIELHIDSERAPGYGGERVLGLLDILDLHGLGEPPSQPKPWMSAAVTAPLTLNPAQTTDLVERTMRYMASGFGFLDLDAADV